jgi:hypothetical protein
MKFLTDVNASGAAIFPRPGIRGDCYRREEKVSYQKTISTIRCSRQIMRRVEAMSDLVSLYQGYHARLAPLMGRIQRTDWLIDQIVYQLYGLTEEEIAVVEGRAA